MTAALLALLLAASQPSCRMPSTVPRLPIVAGRGNSIMFGIGSTYSPVRKLESLLDGGLQHGWHSVNSAVSGETAAQIRARYVLEEATACDGARCPTLYLEGGVNSLRSGVTPAATLTDMVWIVDDALGKGVEVIWTDVTPYGGFSGAGTNPEAQAENYNALMLAACNARASNALLRCTFNYASMEDPANPGRLRDAEPTDYTTDGIHLTQAGTDILAASALAALKSLRGLP